MSVIGMPARGWKLKHDLHHKFGGVPGSDTDREPMLERYLALGGFSRWFVRTFNRHEFLLWWAAPVSLWITTWRFAYIDAKSRRARRPSHNVWLAADMVVAGGFFAAAGLYAARFGWVNLLLLVALPFAVSGLVAAAAFVPNHRGMPPLTSEQARRAVRYTHVNSRTVVYPRYLPGNYFMNYVPWQIEHHVFPTVAGHHLGALSQYLRAYAAREGIPLRYESIFKAMPKLLRRDMLWGSGDGRQYTYAEAEAIRRSRLAATPPWTVTPGA